MTHPAITQAVRLLRETSRFTYSAADRLDFDTAADALENMTQLVIAPRKVYVNFYAGDVGGSQCYRMPERAKAAALGGPTETAVEFEEVTLRLPSAQPVIAPAFKLTDEMIDAAYRKVWSTFPHKERLPAFAREIEVTLTGDKK